MEGMKMSRKLKISQIDLAFGIFYDKKAELCSSIVVTGMPHMKMGSLFEYCHHHLPYVKLTSYTAEYRVY